MKAVIVTGSIRSKSWEVFSNALRLSLIGIPHISQQGILPCTLLAVQLKMYSVSIS